MPYDPNQASSSLQTTGYNQGFNPTAPNPRAMMPSGTYTMGGGTTKSYVTQAGNKYYVESGVDSINGKKYQQIYAPLNPGPSNQWTPQMQSMQDDILSHFSQNPDFQSNGTLAPNYSGTTGVPPHYLNNAGSDFNAMYGQDKNPTVTMKNKGKVNPNAKGVVNGKLA